MRQRRYYRSVEGMFLNEQDFDRKTRKDVVFVSGNISGLPYETAVKAFDLAADKLEKLGYLVQSPVDFVHPETEWDEALRMCISVLATADFIYQLPWWEDSEGAKMEKIVADLLGIPTLFPRR